MFTQLGHQVLVSVGLALVLAACHEAAPVGVATTTAAALSNDNAVLQVARARCRRAAECNRIGIGHGYADDFQCMEAYRDRGAGTEVLRDCPNGVDKRRLEQCVAVLLDQACDADMGPVTAMPSCDSYCSK